MSKRLLALGLGAMLLCAALATGVSLGNEVKIAAAPPSAASQSTAVQSASVQSIEAEEDVPSGAGEIESEMDKEDEEADESLPDGGHADPEGVDTEHQFEGVE